MFASTRTEKRAVSSSAKLLLEFRTAGLAAMVALLGYALSTTAVVNAQGLASPPKLVLKQGEPLSQEIKGGEVQHLSISLAAGQFVGLRVEQHGSILIATLRDPQANEVIEMDSPAGSHGPIYLSAIAAGSGDYELEIRSRDKWSNAANYEVSVDELRSAGTNDYLHLEAEKSFAEGRKLWRADRAAVAITHYEVGVPYWRANENYHWLALTQYALSEAYRNLGKPEKTAESLNECLRVLSIHLDADDWRLKASALNDLGNVYASAGQQGKAMAFLTEGLDLFVSHRDRRGQASSLNSLAQVHGRLGDLTLARELIEKAMVLRRVENDQVGTNNLLNNLAAISDGLGEPDKARDYLARAIQAWEKMDDIRPNDRVKFAFALSNLGTTYDKLGQVGPAREYYDRALAKFAEGDPNRAATLDSAPTLDSKGELYASLGNQTSARDCYEEALRLLPVEKFDPDTKAGILVHVGQLAALQADLPAAARLFEQARDVQPNSRRLADVLTNLGGALASQGQLQRALENYQKAFDLQLKLKDRRGQALTLQKRGEAYSMLGQQTEALADLNRALAFWQSVKDVRGEAATLNSLARVERERENIAGALTRSNQAVAIVEAMRTTISNRQLRTSYFATRENYYGLNIALNMQLTTSNGDGYLATAFEASEKARARVFLDALSEAGVRGNEIDKIADPQVAKLVEHRVTLLGKLAAKTQARTRLLSGQHAAAQIASLDKDIDGLTAQNDELEAQIRSWNPRLSGLIRPPPSTLKEIQQQLDGDTLLLEYSLGEKRSYVWAVTPDSINGFELKGRKEIEAAADHMNKALMERNRKGKNGQQIERQRDQADAQYLKAAAALSEMVIQPVAALLGNKRLVIVADGALQVVPFQALPSPQSTNPLNANTPRSRKSRKGAANDSRPLIEDHEIVYEASASVLALQRKEFKNRQPAQHALAVMADPVFDQEGLKRELGLRASAKNGAGESQSGAPSSKSPKDANVSSRSDLTRAIDDMGIGSISPLPQSRKEAEAIMNLVPIGEGLKEVGFDASRAMAMSPNLSKYRIIHIATHGFANFNHPESSGIVLSMVDEQGREQDGYVRLHEIYNLNLPAQLVVLSACQTGIGKQIRGEGLIALTRGFMYAGAERVVASLWKIDDEATKYLMEEFYKQMFTHKLTPAAALRKAQLKLSHQSNWHAPYYWAGFVLQGEWK